MEYMLQRFEFSEQRKALAHISSYGSHCERAIQKVLKLILNILQGYKQLKGKKGKNLERNPATTCKMVVLTHLWLLLKYMHLPEKLILSTNVGEKTAMHNTYRESLHFGFTQTLGVGPAKTMVTSH